MARGAKAAEQSHGQSDAELVTLTREGDNAAFAELWRRHYAAGMAVARSFTSSFDPDDLVSEAFARTFKLIGSGGGPTVGFRPYLFTVIRNTASTWGASQEWTNVDEANQLEDERFSAEALLEAFDQSLVVKAFRRLPTAWQEVLWYTEVEGMRPREVAPLLGMSANAVAALAYRAREGLRQSWIQTHLATLSDDSECRWTVEHLGAKLRGRLSRRDLRRVNAHLEECPLCPIVAEEAADANRRIALVLLPLAAGVGGAASYTAWLSTSSNNAATAAGVLPQPGGRVSVATNALRTPTAVVASAVMVASALGVITVAVALGVTSSSSETAPPTAATDTTSVPSARDASPAPAAPASPEQAPTPVRTEPASPAPAPSTSASPSDRFTTVSQPESPEVLVPSPVVTAPAERAKSPSTTLSPRVLSPLPGAIVATDIFTVSGVGTPGSHITVQIGNRAFPSTVPAARSLVDASGRWHLDINASAIPDGTYELRTQEARSGSAPASITTSIDIVRQPQLPVVTTVDTGTGSNAGTLFPTVSGTARPGATVSLTAAGRSTTTTADRTGSWSVTTGAGMVAGANTIAISQTDASGRTSRALLLPVTLSALTITMSNRSSSAWISGIPFATIQIAVGGGGWISGALDESGTYVARIDPHRWSATRSISAKYEAGGRSGPTATLTFSRRDEGRSLTGSQ